jgi:arylformamidase
MNALRSADPRERWGELTRQERDAAYDNNAATVNSAELVAARNEASAVFRARGNWRLDLPYGPEAHQKWDIYPAAASAGPDIHSRRLLAAQQPGTFRHHG